MIAIFVKDNLFLLVKKIHHCQILNIELHTSSTSVVSHEIKKEKKIPHYLSLSIRRKRPLYLFLLDDSNLFFMSHKTKEKKTKNKEVSFYYLSSFISG